MSYGSALSVAASSTAAASAFATLAPLSFTPLPLGSIKPNGWLRSELETSADGLAGHEHDFYMYVKDSSWLGGTSEYSDLNEGFPYWFNGLVNMAYSLDDERLKAQVHTTADYVLTHQQDDGWIGPEAVGSRTFWGRYPLFLGLLGLAEANNTWTSKITDSLHTFNGLMNTMLHNNYTGYLPQQTGTIGAGDFDWGRVRSQDMVISLMWLLENDPRDATSQLQDNIQMLYNGALKWEAWYNRAAYQFDSFYNLPKEVADDNYAYIHGVNVAHGLKATAVFHRFTHNESLLQTTHDGVNWTYSYHGASSGNVIADERSDGLEPFAGGELCSAVEAMYSLSYLYQALGTNDFADKSERTAYNALPAMMTPDWWAHQYMEQTNQPFSHNLSMSPFSNVNSFGQTFGLEPNYPCCTVNHPQGYPKHVAASFVGTKDGIAHALLGPARVSLKGHHGQGMTVACQTNYPFSNVLSYTATSDYPFTLSLRFPSWADVSASTLIANGKSIDIQPDPVNGMIPVSLPRGNSEITYTLSTSIRTEPRANDTIAIYHGALLYALEIEAETSSTLPRAYSNKSFYPASYAPPQSKDYIMTNLTAWNVAIDPSTLKFFDMNNATSNAKLASPVWAPGAPPVYMTAMGCQIDWPLYMGSTPGFVPKKEERKCLSGKYEVKLVPFGSAKLRMAELPTVDLA